MFIVDFADVAGAEHMEAGIAVVRKMVVMLPVSGSHDIPSFPMLRGMGKPEVAMPSFWANEERRVA